MAEYGLKVSRQGYDVKSCADHQLLFSSSFKLPLLLASGNYTVTDKTMDQTIYTHGLGYVPLVLLFMRDEVGEQLHMAYTFFDSITSSYNNHIFFDNNKIHWTQDLDGQFKLFVTYFVFAVNLEESYSAPIVNNVAETQGTYNNDWGFKASKDGKNVGTASIDDLSIFSGSSLAGDPVRNNILHKVTQLSVANGETATISHGLGYEPMFLVYIKDQYNGYTPDSLDFTVTPGFEVIQAFRSWCDDSNINIYNNTGSSLDIICVIFKDPFV